jgi:hypothetical protein
VIKGCPEVGDCMSEDKDAEDDTTGVTSFELKVGIEAAAAFDAVAAAEVAVAAGLGAAPPSSSSNMSSNEARACLARALLPSN